VLITLFPAFNPTYICRNPEKRCSALPQLRKRVERVYHFWNGNSAWILWFETFHLSFCAGWVQKRWGAHQKYFIRPLMAFLKNAPKKTSSSMWGVTRSGVS
jgi:hypothetical protein